MAKKRKNKQKIMKRKIGWSIVGIILALVLGFIIFNLDTTRFSITGDSEIPTEDSLPQFSGNGIEVFEDSYISTESNLINEKQSGILFAFVDVKSTDVVQYTKTYEHPNVIFKSAGTTAYLSTPKGDNCNLGEVIRYRRCSSTDKSTCTQDLFTEVWQVQKKDYDHPVSNDYYIFTENIYYTYSCYEPGQIFPDNFERSWLVDGKCVGSKDAGGRGINYETEKACLKSLEALNNPNYEDTDLQNEAVQQYKKDCETLGGTYNSITADCIFTIRESQVVALEEDCKDLGGVFNDKTLECNFPEIEEKKPTSTTSTSQLTSSDKEQICEDNDGYYDSTTQKCIFSETKDASNKEKICSDNGLTYDSELDKCIGDDEENEIIFDSVDEEVFNQLTDDEDEDEEESLDATICLPYESYNEETGECKFSITKAFTPSGLNQLWKDFTTWIIIAGAIVLVVGVSIYRRNKRNKSQTYFQSFNQGGRK